MQNIISWKNFLSQHCVCFVLDFVFVFCRFVCLFVTYSLISTDFTCPNGWQKCADGKQCFQTDYLCDSKVNCNDSSDEDETMCKSKLNIILFSFFFEIAATWILCSHSFNWIPWPLKTTPFGSIILTICWIYGFTCAME